MFSVLCGELDNAKIIGSQRVPLLKNLCSSTWAMPSCGPHLFPDLNCVVGVVGGTIVLGGHLSGSCGEGAQRHSVWTYCRRPLGEREQRQAHHPPLSPHVHLYLVSPTVANRTALWNPSASEVLLNQHTVP